LEKFKNFNEEYVFEKLSVYCEFIQLKVELSQEIDWLSILIEMREHVMSKGHLVEKSTLIDTVRDRKRRQLNLVNEHFANFIINKFIYHNKLSPNGSNNDYRNETEIFLIKLIINSNIEEIKKLNFALSMKADVRIVLKQVSSNISSDQITSEWNKRLASYSNALKKNKFTFIVGISRKRNKDDPTELLDSTELDHNEGGPGQGQERKRAKKFLPSDPATRFGASAQCSTTVVTPPGLSGLGFILEQLSLFCYNRGCSLGSKPIDWTQHMVAMREYCNGEKQFDDSDLRRKYRNLNIFIDNTANFVVNKYLLGTNCTGGGIEGPEVDYLFPLICFSEMESIARLNLAIFLKEDNRYPLRAIPSGDNSSQMEEAWRARSVLINACTDISRPSCLLVKIPTWSIIRNNVIFIIFVLLFFIYIFIFILI
jgi:hypothetical protein